MLAFGTEDLISLSMPMHHCKYTLGRLQYIFIVKDTTSDTSEEQICFFPGACNGGLIVPCMSVVVTFSFHVSHADLLICDRKL